MCNCRRQHRNAHLDSIQPNQEPDTAPASPRVWRVISPRTTHSRSPRASEGLESLYLCASGDCMLCSPHAIALEARASQRHTPCTPRVAVTWTLRPAINATQCARSSLGIARRSQPQRRPNHPLANTPPPNDPCHAYARAAAAMPPARLKGQGEATDSFTTHQAMFNPHPLRGASAPVGANSTLRAQPAQPRQRPRLHPVRRIRPPPPAPPNSAHRPQARPAVADCA